MNCPKCGAQTEPLPRPPTESPTWDRCPSCKHWWVANTALAQTTYHRTGALDDQPLCPDKHEGGR